MRFIEACGGLAKIELLRLHYDEDLCEKAVRIVEKYFVEEGEEQMPCERGISLQGLAFLRMLPFDGGDADGRNQVDERAEPAAVSEQVLRS